MAAHNKTVVRYGAYIQDDTHSVIRADVQNMADRELFSLEGKVSVVREIISEECNRRIKVWHDEGLSQRAMSERVGLSTTQINVRFQRLGLIADPARGGKPRSIPIGDAPEDLRSPEIIENGHEPAWPMVEDGDDEDEAPQRRIVDVRHSLSVAASALEVLRLKLAAGQDRVNDDAADLLDKIDHEAGLLRGALDTDGTL